MVPAHLALADAYIRMSERALAEQAIRAGLDGHARLAGAAGQARADPGEIMITTTMLMLVGHAGTQAPSAKTVQISAPAQVGTIDTGKLKGEPTQLAWSPDGTKLFLQTSERDSSRDDEQPPFLRDVGGRRQAGAGRRAAGVGRRVLGLEVGQVRARVDHVRHRLQGGIQDRRAPTAAPMGGDLARGGADASGGGGTSADEVALRGAADRRSSASSP